jgi:thiol:disulfide interchange protein DsbA
LTSNQVDPSLRRFLGVSATIAAALAAGCATPSATTAAPVAPVATVPDEPPEEGFEFRAIEPPQPTATGGRLEVVEFFWFGCPHCNAMEPIIDAWLRGQPGDVALRHVHPALTPRWQPQQRLFYALEATGRARALRAHVFHAIHVGGRRFDEREAIADFIAGLGEDRPRFLGAFDSDDVLERMRRADAHARAVRLEGVPGLAVQGRWLTSPGMAGSYAGALEVVDHLLARDRGAPRSAPAAGSARPPAT